MKNVMQGRKMGNVGQKRENGQRQLFSAQRSWLLATGLLAIIGLGSCSKQQADVPAAAEEPLQAHHQPRQVEPLAFHYRNLPRITLWQLQQARAATAKYYHLEKAIDDGYADIHVVAPNMGYHYMKANNVDTLFDPRKPEILVYNKNSNGNFYLVAVEYAVPIDQMPDHAPEGFAGNADVWDRNTGFGLWLLHAWVWQFNPEGVFHPTNPQVTVL